MIVTSLAAIANKFVDRPRLGAKATSCTDSVMLIASILACFLKTDTPIETIDKIVSTGDAQM